MAVSGGGVREVEVAFVALVEVAFVRYVEVAFFISDVACLPAPARSLARCLVACCVCCACCAVLDGPLCCCALALCLC